MSNINELNININKAVVTTVTLKLGKEGLGVTVTGSLMTQDNREVSGFCFTTKQYSWDSENDIIVPPSLNLPAKEIFEMLTPVIYEKLNGAFPAIKAGKRK